MAKMELVSLTRENTLGMVQKKKNPLKDLFMFSMLPSLFLYSLTLGELIPGSAVLVFDIHVIDFHNPRDPVEIKVTHKPQECKMTSEANDLIQYRYNCSLMDGTLLYSS